MAGYLPTIGRQTKRPRVVDAARPVPRSRHDVVSRTIPCEPERGKSYMVRPTPSISFDEANTPGRIPFPGRDSSARGLRTDRGPSSDEHGTLFRLTEIWAATTRGPRSSASRWPAPRKSTSTSIENYTLSRGTAAESARPHCLSRSHRGGGSTRWRSSRHLRAGAMQAEGLVIPGPPEVGGLPASDGCRHRAMPSWTTGSVKRCSTRLSGGLEGHHHSVKSIRKGGDPACSKALKTFSFSRRSQPCRPDAHTCKHPLNLRFPPNMAQTVLV